MNDFQIYNKKYSKLSLHKNDNAKVKMKNIPPGLKNIFFTNWNGLEISSQIGNYYDKLNLLDCFIYSGIEEMLDGDNMIYCNNCHRLTKGINKQDKQLLIIIVIVKIYLSLLIQLLVIKILFQNIKKCL